MADIEKEKESIIIEKQVIDLNSSTITVATSGSNIPDTEYNFPANFPSVEIATAATANMIDFRNSEKEKQIIETIDYVKTNGTFISEVEVALNFEEGFKFKFKRSPKKIVKFFSEK